ncbi:MAG: WD40 repeat domain-containing serine/threonine protein kinase, partial [Planctomycetota bacterium]
MVDGQKTPRHDRAEEEPDRVGVYRVLDVLGEGGMGTVYLAEQKEPVRRRVALKVIKLGMDTKQVLGRFEAERQALAMMEHSCIAKVFEAGATPDGRPYFVMECVRGRSITQYCDEHRLTIGERLDLFRHICSAVQHAHQKGIIHRDLKPSNVLVTLQEGRPVPKIIDFGLARATDHRLVEATVYTEQGQIIGTPEYMSPEQAGLDELDVDTRTDIYSLGVMLYELLVGALPFERAELRRAGLLELQRMIRETDPPKPSTRLSSMGGRTDAARLRGTDIHTLLRKLRGDLDWIVMKALEKHRIRRYPTAGELAADLKRHQNHEPVLACQPSLGYRLGKFGRRYSLQLVAVLAVLVTLLGGIIGTTISAVIARANALEAERQKEIAEKNERRANESERIAREQARESLRQAYFASIAAARAAVQANEPANVRAHLSRAPEEFRNWEWGYLRSFSEQAEGEKQTLVLAHDWSIRAASFGPNSTRVLTASWDNAARVWDAETGRQTALLLGHLSPLRAASFSPDGTRIATASEDDTAIVWDAATGQRTLVLDGHEGLVADASFDGSGTRVVTASSDSTARVWDASSGKQTLVLRGHADVVSRASFSADSAWILTASGDRTARVWDAETGRQIALLSGHEDVVTGASFDPSGTRVVTASLDGTARVWDAETGRQLAVLEGHAGPVSGAAFDPRGTRVVTASADRTARVWDAQTGAVIAVLRGHGGRVHSASFSPDGTRVVTASGDETARVWDAETGTQTVVLRGHGSRVLAGTFSRDGTRILTFSADRTARVWDSVSRATLERARPEARRVLDSLLGKSSDALEAATELRALPGLDPRVRRAALDLLDKDPASGNFLH